MLLQLFAHATGKLVIWRGEVCSLANQALADANQPIPYQLNLARLFRDQSAVLQDYEKSLALRHSLIRIDPTNAQWRHDEACILDRIGDEYCRAGLSYQAAASYEVSAAIWRQLAKIDPRSQTRDLAISLRKLGDAKLATADTMAAMAAYEEAATNWRRLLRREPDNTSWQMKLAEVLEKLGDLELEADDTTGALKAYEELVRIDRGLFELDANNAEWQWNLSLSLDRVGDVQLAQGDTNAARLAYEDSLAIRRSLLEADTSTSRWQDAVSSSLRKIADVEQLAAERAEAEAARREMRGIHRLLFEMDEISADLEDRLSITATQSEQSTPRNLARLEKSLTVRRQLAISCPTNLSHEYDLSADLEELADLSLELGDLREAFEAYQESLAIRRRLAETAQNNREWQQTLCTILEKVGAVKETENDHAAAISLYEESLDLRRRIIEFDNNHQTYASSDEPLRLAPALSTTAEQSYAQLNGELKTQAQFDLVVTLKKLARAKLKALDSCGALAALEESLTIARQLFRAKEKSNVISKAVQKPTLSSANEMSTEIRLVLEKHRAKISALLGEISTRARAVAQASKYATEMVRDTTIAILGRRRKLCSILLSQISVTIGEAKLARAERAARLVMIRLWRRGQKQGPAVVHKLSIAARAAAQRSRRAAKTVRLVTKQLSRRQRQRFYPIRMSASA